ncbi:hypothetical protein FJZ19_04455 [Candidatus Pacearchaeota archaeon]|nr:hypothetical protein [Candidatus Pacearchaeota archaeon]
MARKCPYYSVCKGHGDKTEDLCTLNGGRFPLIRIGNWGLFYWRKAICVGQYEEHERKYREFCERQYNETTSQQRKRRKSEFDEPDWKD